eukprot:CAMPEP_0172520516 /NCGR_PEP_ID=MMETSP1066-20121228/292051_1 /TAXON_ID=671091 /ORGANISM="Coscinodiscus wailesii, Strain CCMP2513" /LENGTH=1056 /DNA_ID=CAMNT_0013303295 /DNA_START=550 /DNA_END=3720 /DNA_ORIENTATION=+
MSDADYDGIWEELNDERTREIRAHLNSSKTNQSTFSSGGGSSSFYRYGRDNPLRTCFESAAARVSDAFNHKSLSPHKGFTTTNSGIGNGTNGLNSSTNPLSEFGLFSKWGGGAMEMTDCAATTADSDPLLQRCYDGGGVSLSPPQQQHKRGFVLLDQFKMGNQGDGWEAVPDLDLFFTNMYHYYYNRGFVSIVGKGVIELVSLWTTLWISVFLFAYLDWGELLKCRDESSCNSHIGDYIIDKPFSEITPTRFVIVVYILVFSTYGVLSSYRVLTTVRDAWHTKSIYEDKIGITPAALEGGAVEWDEIVSKLISKQNSGEYRVCIDGYGGGLDALVIAMRIMRQENFVVGLLNLNLVDVSVPFLPATMRKVPFLSQSLEWSLYVCVLNHVWSQDRRIRPSFYMDVGALKRRFVICGLVQLVFMPFLLLFMLLHFLLVNVHQIRSSKQYMGPRDWSYYSKWTFREFNELPHIFERRLAPSYADAEDYLKLLTPTTALSFLGRGVMFLSGSLLAVLIGFAAASDSILVHVKLGSHNLLWYVGALGVLFGLGKTLVPDDVSTRSRPHGDYFATTNAALARVAGHTHYLPSNWRNGAWKTSVRSQFKNMFLYKSQLFLIELLSVVFAPLILCISLPRCADGICQFVRQTKVTVPGVGDVCAFSCFDFDHWGDENWRDGDEDDDHSAGEDHCATANKYKRYNDKPQTRLGKMEKSFFNFKAAHPSWKCQQINGQQNLVERVEAYKKEQEEALAKERQLYVEAAARQLEVLRVMEQTTRPGMMGSTVLPTIHESYLHEKHTRTTTGPTTDVHGINSGLTTQNSAKSTTADNDDDDSTADYHSCSNTTIPAESSLLASQSRLLESSHDQHPSLQQQQQHTPLPLSSSSSSSYQPLQHSIPNNNNVASVLHYADGNLSTELQRLLNQSKFIDNVTTSALLELDPSNNTTSSTLLLASLLMKGSTTVPDIMELSQNITNTTCSPTPTAAATQREYRWLERYHSRQTRDSNNNNTPAATAATVTKSVILEKQPQRHCSTADGGRREQIMQQGNDTATAPNLSKSSFV